MVTPSGLLLIDSSSSGGDLLGLVFCSGQANPSGKQTDGRKRTTGDSSFRNQIETTARRPAKSNPLIIERLLLAIDSKCTIRQPMKDETFA